MSKSRQRPISPFLGQSRIPGFLPAPSPVNSAPRTGWRRLEWLAVPFAVRRIRRRVLGEATQGMASSLRTPCPSRFRIGAAALIHPAPDAPAPWRWLRKVLRTDQAVLGAPGAPGYEGRAKQSPRRCAWTASTLAMKVHEASRDPIGAKLTQGVFVMEGVAGEIGAEDVSGALSRCVRRRIRMLAVDLSEDRDSLPARGRWFGHPQAQMRSPYSRIARSDENLPDRAVLRMDIRVQRAGSCQAASTRVWQALESAKSASTRK